MELIGLLADFLFLPMLKAIEKAGAKKAKVVVLEEGGRGAGSIPAWDVGFVKLLFSQANK